MLSIFSPRVDKNGVLRLKLTNKKFDEFYIDQTIKKTYRCVNPSAKPEDQDFVESIKVVESKRDIRQVINSQNQDLPDIDEAIKRFAETGDLTALPPGMNDGEIVDYTKLPEDHAAYMKFMQKAEAEYDNLPADLKGKLSLSEFVKIMDDKKLAAYYESIKPQEKVEVKKEEKKDE